MSWPFHTAAQVPRHTGKNRYYCDSCLCECKEREQALASGRSSNSSEDGGALKILWVFSLKRLASWNPLGDGTALNASLWGRFICLWGSLLVTASSGAIYPFWKTSESDWFYLIHTQHSLKSSASCSRRRDSIPKDLTASYLVFKNNSKPVVDS